MKELLKKSSIANVVAGVIVIVAIVYAAYTGDKDLIQFLAGAAIGYLFKRGAE